MSITVSAESVAGYQGTASSAQLRIYALTSFTDTNNVFNAAGAVGSRSFFFSIGCTITNGIINVPQINHPQPETTDAGTRFTAAVYTRTGTLLVTLASSYLLPTTVTPTTWDAIRIFNGLNAGGGGGNSGGVAAWGNITGTLSSQTDLQNALNAKQDALVSGVNIKTVNGQALPGSGNISISGGALVTLANTYGNDLVTAVAAIGSTPTTLFVDANTTVTTHIDIPATLNLAQLNEATITVSGAGSLTFGGRCIQGNELAFFAVSATPDFLWGNSGQVDVAGNAIDYTNHGFTTGQQLIYTVFPYASGTGTEAQFPIGGLSDNGIYYAIRTSANVLKLASSYANALSGTAIDFTDAGGFQFLMHHCPLYFSGTEVPPTVSSELIDTGDNSESSRTNVLTRALTGNGCWINVYPRQIDEAVFIANSHNIRLMPGLHVNVHDGTTGSQNHWPYSPFSLPWVLKKDSEFTSEKGAICQQSSVDYINGIVGVEWKSENCTIHHNHFRQDRPETLTGSASPISIGGGYNNHILDNVAEKLKCYVYSINPARPGIDDPRSCTCRRNIVLHSLTQIFFIGGGDELDFSDNFLDMKDFTANPIVSCSPFDIEPNGPAVLTNIWIERNTFDTRGMNNTGGNILSFIRVNPAGVHAPANFFIRDNKFLVTYPTENPADGRFLPIDVNGVDNIEVSGNYYEGAGNGYWAQSYRYCRRGRVFNNTSKSGASGILLINSQELEVFNNKALLTPDYVVNTINFPDISEADGATASTALQYFLGTYKSANVVAFAPGTPGFGVDGGYIFKHFLQSTVYINDAPYTITGINNYDFSTYPVTEMTVSPNFSGTPTIHMAVPNTDISTVTDQIHYIGHGYVTGAGIAYLPSGSHIVGSLGDLYGALFVIRVDADNFKLAYTYENALAGTAIDIVTVPVGTHDFYTSAVAFSTDNDFHDNSTGGSELRMANAHSSTLVRKATVTIDPASINANTVSSQTFTLLGARTGDVLALNPPAAGLTAGLVVQQAFVSASDTITIVFNNTTGSPINEPSGTWTYSLDR